MTGETQNALFYAAVVSLGGFLFGFDATVISGVVGFITREMALDEWQQGIVVSAPTLAAVLAALTVGPLADARGRKRVLKLLALLYSISSVLSALAPNFPSLVAARLIGGYAFGSLLLAPIYIAEISPARLRGLMVSVNQLNIVIGFSAAYFTNYYILRLSQGGADWVTSLAIDTETWRWMLGLEAVPAIAYLSLLSLVPESPRWLLVKGRVDDARQVLKRFVSPGRLEEAVARIRTNLRQTAGRTRIRVTELARPGLRFPLAVGLVVAVAQQLTGVNAVYFYAPTIFEQSGVGTNAAFAQAIWLGVTNVVFTVVAMLLIDRWGRKPLLVAGLAGVFLSLSLSAYGFHLATYQLDSSDVAHLSESIPATGLEALIGVEYPDDLAYKRALGEAIGAEATRSHQAALIQAAIRVPPRLILLGILCFVASFAVSLGPVMWVLLSEIFPNRVRGLAMSFVVFFNSSISFGVQLVFPWQLANFGSALTFLIYGMFAAVGLVVVAWLLPETKGRSLEELEEDFATRSAAAG